MNDNECRIVGGSSRMCERGTKTCETRHVTHGDVTTGSLPISSAEALCDEWEAHAQASDNKAEQQDNIGIVSVAKQLREYSKIYRRHAEQLRRLAGLPILRDWPEDFTNDLDNGAYNCQCIVCKLPFTGHKRRFICKICNEKDMEEARKRADWLHEHKAPKGWLILTEMEIAVISREMAELTEREYQERSARKDLQKALDNLLSNRGPYQLDRAKEALEESKRLDGASPV